MSVALNRLAQAEHTPLRTSTDEENLLGLRLARGDERAFEEVVRQYGPMVLTLARRLNGWCEQDAEDAAQEVFVRVYLKRKQFRSDSSLKTWLTRITVNRCRSLQRRKLLGLETLWRALGQKEVSVPQAETDEVAAQVRHAVRLLPAKEREVIVFYYLEEMTAEDVATILELTPGAVNVRLHRARQRLERLLMGVGGLDDAR